MKKAISLIVIPFLFFGCESAFEEIRENRIEGLWEFDKAFYRFDGDLFRDDIFHEFEGDRIYFYDGQSAVYEDYSLNASFEGSWFVERETFIAGDDTDTEFFLDMEFYDHVNEEYFSYVGRITWQTRNNLNMRMWDGLGEYTFRLDRVRE